MSFKNWTRENELYCQRIGEQSSVYNWMHLQSERHYKNRSYYVSCAVNVISVMSAIMGVIDSFSPSDHIKISIKTLTILTAALVKYYTSSKDREIASVHKKTASEYYKIYDSIQYELTMPQTGRSDALLLIKSFRDQFVNLQSSSPTLPKSIIDEFNDKYKFNNITKPIISGELNEISLTPKFNESRRDNNPPVVNKVKGEPKNSWMRRASKLSKNSTRDINFSYKEYAAESKRRSQTSADSTLPSLGSFELSSIRHNHDNSPPMVRVNNGGRSRVVPQMKENKSLTSELSESISDDSSDNYNPITVTISEPPDNI